MSDDEQAPHEKAGKGPVRCHSGQFPHNPEWCATTNSEPECGASHGCENGSRVVVKLFVHDDVAAIIGSAIPKLGLEQLRHEVERPDAQGVVTHEVEERGRERFLETLFRNGVSQVFGRWHAFALWGGAQSGQWLWKGAAAAGVATTSMLRSGGGHCLYDFRLRLRLCSVCCLSSFLKFVLFLFFVCPIYMMSVALCVLDGRFGFHYNVIGVGWGFGRRACVHVCMRAYGIEIVGASPTQRQK